MYTQLYTYVPRYLSKPPHWQAVDGCGPRYIPASGHLKTIGHRVVPWQLTYQGLPGLPGVLSRQVRLTLFRYFQTRIVVLDNIPSFPREALFCGCGIPYDPAP